MALKFTVQIKAQGVKKLEKKLDTLKNKAIDRATAKRAGKAVLDEMLDMIEGGNSPISGGGKFPAYKNPSRYPGKRKRHSPVNLRLSGDFLDSLKVVLIRAQRESFGFSIGYRTQLSRRKEQGHREGANTQPRRPTIPQPPNEKFARRIVNKYRKVFEKRIRKITRK